MATINGTSFADNLVGTGAADNINGRAGNDVIRGGGGRDTITLGSGSDTVVYTTASDSPFASNWDVITDFAQGTDRIDLSALLGTVDLTWGGLNATANGVWYSRSGTTVSIFIDTNGAPATPEMRIELRNISTTTVLAASDFIGVVERINAAPVFTSQANWTVAENGTAIGTVVATDADSPTVTYSLAGADASRFSVDPATGVLRFVMEPDFERAGDVGADNVYNFTVQASDGTLNTTQAVTVTVTNVNEAAPAITSPATFTVAENDTAVGTVVATDADSPSVTYSLVDGGDSEQFSIDPATGVLSFMAAPDFEAPADVGADNVYNVTVQASDGTLNTTQAVAVTVTNVNETPTGSAPVITSPATFTLRRTARRWARSSPPTRTARALTYSLVDRRGFGAFRHRRHHRRTELPGRAGLRGAGRRGRQQCLQLHGAGQRRHAQHDPGGDRDGDQCQRDAHRHGTGDHLAGDLQRGREQHGGGHGHSDRRRQSDRHLQPGDGGDSARFAINATTGALSFPAAPDFEAPADVGADNVYNFTVQASDGTLNTTQAVAVTVTNIVSESLTGDAAANTLVGTAANDIITGNGGADTLTGNGGNDNFVYASAQDSRANTNWQTPPDGSVTRVWDIITDFVQGADKIDVSAFLGATNLAWANNTPTGNAVWYVNSGTQTFIYADIDNNPPPDVMIALQNRGSMTLTANDFIGVVGGFTGGGTALRR